MAALSVSVPSGVLASSVGVTMRVSGRGLSVSASSALPNPESSRNSASACSAVMTRTVGDVAALAQLLGQRRAPARRPPSCPCRPINRRPRSNCRWRARHWTATRSETAAGRAPRRPRPWSSASRRADARCGRAIRPGFARGAQVGLNAAGMPHGAALASTAPVRCDSSVVRGRCAARRTAR